MRGKSLLCSLNRSTHKCSRHSCPLKGGEVCYQVNACCSCELITSFSKAEPGPWQQVVSVVCFASLCNTGRLILCLNFLFILSVYKSFTSIVRTCFFVWFVHKAQFSPEWKPPWELLRQLRWMAGAASTMQSMNVAHCITADNTLWFARSRYYCTPLP